MKKKQNKQTDEWVKFAQPESHRHYVSGTYSDILFTLWMDCKKTKKLKKKKKKYNEHNPEARSFTPRTLSARKQAHC